MSAAVAWWNAAAVERARARSDRGAVATLVVVVTLVAAAIVDQAAKHFGRWLGREARDHSSRGASSMASSRGGGGGARAVVVAAEPCAWRTRRRSAMTGAPARASIVNRTESSQMTYTIVRISEAHEATDQAQCSCCATLGISPQRLAATRAGTANLCNRRRSRNRVGAGVEKRRPRGDTRGAWQRSRRARFHPEMQSRTARQPSDSSRAIERKHAIVADGDSRATLTIDEDDFPFAYPLVKTPSGWRFDAKAGNAELLARRVGANELAVMNVLLAIVDAQREYASQDRDGDRRSESRRKFASTPGKKDGLYWPTAAGEPPSPLGTLVARAAGQGYKKTDGPQPYHGYYFRLLKGQGPKATGGAYDYTVKGRPIGGFAVIAYPAKYANSGVMTFMVNHDGVVHEKDLGPDTANLARGITRFDPGPGWKALSIK